MNCIVDAIEQPVDEVYPRSASEKTIATRR